MGTLTADCPRLDSHCPHKLATSCRLTSTPNCCACADERPHSLTYRVYIDGVGFVHRGTRWQSYCWFCKEFWSNRIAATDPPLEVSQTRIPEVPDQTEFLERWFEFHQGYRIVKGPDGTEQRVAVIGEDFRDVSPGFLPRTLHQLRTRTPNDARRPENRFRRRRLSSEEDRPEEPVQSIEDALNNLLETASDEGQEAETREEAQVPREATTAPSISEATQTPLPISRNEARTQRARERFVARVFGTREELEQDDYESPIATMYTRAFQRFRQAEERRASGDTEGPASLDSLPPNERQEIEQQLLWGVMRDSRQETQAGQAAPAAAQESSMREVESATSVFESGTAAWLAAVDALRTPSDGGRWSPAHLQAISQALGSGFILPGFTPEVSTELDMDKQNRPPPLEDEQMTKTLACQVCYSQLADIAVLPCGHMVLCEWCADTIIPVKHSHTPINTSSKCPKCRRKVKQRYKIHM